MSTLGFRHDALLYRGADDFVRQVTGFIDDSLSAGHPIQVMVVPEKIALLRDSLGSDAKRVRFADMAEIGRNPNRIIPAWASFFDEAGGRYARGIGEPIWASRTEEELVESQRHEALINLAFREASGWILCPYDVEALDEDVIDVAFDTHPTIGDGHTSAPSRSYLDVGRISQPFDAPLLEPAGSWDGMSYGSSNLDGVRSFADAHARNAGFSRERSIEIVLAISELATNSLRHGGGEGSIRAWLEPGELVIEVRDGGRIVDALAGRVRPQPTSEGGYGLWIVNQLADLVQVRTFPSGSTIRVHFAR